MSVEERDDAAAASAVAWRKGVEDCIRELDRHLSFLRSVAPGAHPKPGIVETLAVLRENYSAMLWRGTYSSTSAMDVEGGQ